MRIRFSLSVLSLAAILLLSSAGARAGDEVDYSAPYLTVENGELVTRYPAKAHVPDAAREAPAGQAAPAASQADVSLPAAGAVLVLLCGIAAAVVVYRKRRAGQSGVV